MIKSKILYQLLDSNDTTQISISALEAESKSKLIYLSEFLLSVIHVCFSFLLVYFNHMNLSIEHYSEYLRREENIEKIL